MSYRYRFIIAKNDNCLKLRNMTYGEILKYIKKHNPEAYNADDDEFAYIEVENMFRQKEILEMNDKFVIDSVNANSERFFTLDDTDEYFEEANIRLCNKNTFKKAIFALRLSILNNYKEILSEPTEDYSLSIEDKAKAFIAGKVQEWDLMSSKYDDPEVKKSMEKFDEEITPFNLDEEVERIVSSNRYEYLIFEMARLYKTIDFDNYCLIFYGW